MIIVCTPANPSGKVMTQTELEAIAEVAKELDLLVVSDEVYEHYVFGRKSAYPDRRFAGYVGADDHGQFVFKIVEYFRLATWLRLRQGRTDSRRSIMRRTSFTSAPATPLQTALSQSFDGG